MTEIIKKKNTVLSDIEMLQVDQPKDKQWGQLWTINKGQL